MASGSRPQTAKPTNQQPIINYHNGQSTNTMKRGRQQTSQQQSQTRNNQQLNQNNQRAGSKNDKSLMRFKEKIEQQREAYEKNQKKGKIKQKENYNQENTNNMSQEQQLGYVKPIQVQTYQNSAQSSAFHSFDNSKCSAPISSQSSFLASQNPYQTSETSRYPPKPQLNILYPQHLQLQPNTLKSTNYICVTQVSTPHTQRIQQSGMKPPMLTSDNKNQAGKRPGSGGFGASIEKAIRDNKINERPGGYFGKRSNSTQSTTNKKDSQTNSSQQKHPQLSHKLSLKKLPIERQRSLSIGFPNQPQSRNTNHHSNLTTPKQQTNNKHTIILSNFKQINKNSFQNDQQPIKKLKIIKKKKQVKNESDSNKQEQTENGLSLQLRQKLNLFYKGQSNMKQIKIKVSDGLQTTRNTNQLNNHILQPIQQLSNECQTARNILQLPNQIFKNKHQPIMTQNPQQKAIIPQRTQKPMNQIYQQQVQQDNNNNNSLSDSQNLVYSQLFTQLQEIPDEQQPEDDSQDFINNLIKFNVDMQQFIQNKDSIQNQIESMRQVPFIYPQLENVQGNINQQSNVKDLQNTQQFNHHQQPYYQEAQQNKQIYSNQQQQPKLPNLSSGTCFYADNDQYPNEDFKEDLDYGQFTTQQDQNLLQQQMTMGSAGTLMRSGSGLQDEEEMEYSSDEGGMLESQTSGMLRSMRTRDLN